MEIWVLKSIKVILADQKDDTQSNKEIVRLQPTEIILKSNIENDQPCTCNRPSQQIFVSSKFARIDRVHWTRSSISK